MIFSGSGQLSGPTRTPAYISLNSINSTLQEDLICAPSWKYCKSPNKIIGEKRRVSDILYDEEDIVVLGKAVEKVHAKKL